MKTFIFIFTFVFGLSACAMSKRSTPIPRKLMKKMWRYCEPGEVENFQGKVCNRTCLKNKCKNKSDFITTVKDPSNKKEDHMFFVNGSHIIVTEEQYRSR